MATTPTQYKKAIEALILRLNHATNSHEKPYTVHEEGPVCGKLTPNANNFHLDNQNHRWSLRRMSAEAGCSGSTDVLNASRSLPEIYDLIRAYVAGVEMGKELSR